MADDVAIRVKNLGKRYKLGQQTGGYKTLGETITRAVKSRFQRLQRQNSEEKEEVGTFWALKDVSFEVKKGEVLGIIGRNGAGKSTLLKILSRITAPTEGTVEINGRVGSLLEVGTGFHPELTGRENIFLSGSIMGMKKTEIDEKFDQIVKFAEIEKFLDTPVKRYSSGMYVRLAFAVAAHLEPEILIVDEVLAVGDAEFQKKCLGKMGDVASEGRTVIFVSHNMNAVEELCKSCILFEKGEIVEYTSNVRQVIKKYIMGDGYTIQSEWKNSNNEFDNPWFKPLSIFFVDSKNQKVTMPIRNDEEIWICIQGITEKPASELTIGYAVYSEGADLLYWTYQTDDISHQPSLRIGYNRLKSKIPKKIFNEGIFRFEFIGGLHNIKWLYEPGISTPTVYLQIQGGLSDSPYWLAKRPGLLAPLLKWENDLQNFRYQGDES